MKFLGAVALFGLIGKRFKSGIIFACCSMKGVNGLKKTNKTNMLRNEEEGLINCNLSDFPYYCLFELWRKWLITLKNVSFC
jgi:hypothetical protein